jgi:hypothetical protein
MDGPGWDSWEEGMWRVFGWPKKLAGLPPGLDQIFSQPKLFMML